MAKRHTVVFPPTVLFSSGELHKLDALQHAVPEERVTSGDAGDTHDVYVRRIVIDEAGRTPEVVNRPYSDPILAILSDAEKGRILGTLAGTGSGHFIRRCQFNRLTTGS